MNRSTVDRLISTTGIVVAVVLLAASGVLFYAHNFVHSQVHDQLAAQKISFPAAGSSSLSVLPAADKAAMSKYAGQQLTTGAQAETFADHYIAVHLKEVAGGKTYSELSTLSRANPNDKKLAGEVDTVFKGETLRGLLLNAYAFDTMAVVASYAAFGALVAGVVLLVLAALGFRHAGLTKPTKRR
jgi:hypothetical protein